MGVEIFGFQNASLELIVALSLVSLFLVCVIPLLFRLKILNGLLVFQIQLFFCTLVMLNGYFNNFYKFGLLVHFFLIEFIFFIGILSLYKMATARLLTLYIAMLRAIGRHPILYVLFIALLLLFKMANYTEDGSRIFYMTQFWYSYVKPFITILEPLAYFVSLSFLLRRNTRVYGYISICLSVAANIYTGSKASFVLGYLTTFLFINDIGVLRGLAVNRTHFLVFIFGMAITASFTIASKGIGLLALGERFIRYAEANALTYFTSDPSSACQNLSLIARMHRGLARMFGDAGAINIDTLFGYALTIEAVGANTFTGPNARISAYFICNFSGSDFFPGALVVLYYLLITYLLIYLCSRLSSLFFFLLPAVIFSIVNSAQDFNLIMRDFLYYSFFCLVCFFVFVLVLSFRNGGRKID